MATAAEKQAAQRAAQVAVLNESQKAPTTGGIQPNYNPYTDPVNTELRRGPANLAPDDVKAHAPEGVYTPWNPAGATGETVSAVGTDPTLTAARTSAFAQFKNLLDSWGLSDLAGWATSLYQSENAPTSFNEFYLQLKQQPVYVERFGKTNDQRIKSGLPALSEASIMGLETQYKKTLASYGLPASFYDQPADFQKFIVNDLSASEVADRVQAADAFVKMKDPTIRQQLSQFYGIGDGALVAAQLDPTRGQQIIEQLAAKQTAAIAAGTAGLGVREAQQAQEAGAGNMSFSQQAQAFGQAAQTAQLGSNLSAIYAAQGGPQYGTEQAVSEAFNGATAFQDQEKRKRLAKMEEGTFGGSSGAGAGSLGTGQTAGTL